MRTKIEEILKECITEIDLSSKSLIDDGYINSLAIIQLVAELDDAFDIIITYESITKENFNSVESIEKMVRSYLHK